MVDRQTEGIAHSTSMIQTSVDRVKAGLTDFAGDARHNGEQLHEAEGRLSKLEFLSNDMLDRLSHSGVWTDDTPFLDIARDGNQQIEAAISAGLAEGEIDLESVFDMNYIPISNTNPQQFMTRFCNFADAHIRPILDCITAKDTRIISAIITDMNAYRPTHISEYSKPQGSDPDWNARYSRNRRFGMNEPTRRAIESDKKSMLVVMRLEQFGTDSYLPVKEVFVSTFVTGRRWGNLGLAFRDDSIG
jgi:methyl-accepting chemotaxis protein